MTGDFEVVRRLLASRAVEAATVRIIVNPASVSASFARNLQKLSRMGRRLSKTSGVLFVLENKGVGQRTHPGRVILNATTTRFVLRTPKKA